MAGLEWTGRNLKFAAHIIKDVFDPKEGVILYGTQFNLMTVLRDPEFGIEVWGLHSNENLIGPDYTYLWNIGVNNSHFGRDYANLVISLDYGRNFQARYHDLIALHMSNLIKDNGLLFTVNPGNWASRFDAVFQREEYLEQEIKRYTLFKDEQVSVYKK